MKDPFKNLLLTILNEYSDIKKFGYGGNKLNEYKKTLTKNMKELFREGQTDGGTRPCQGNTRKNKNLV